MPVTNSASDRSQRCNTGGAARPLFFFQSQPHATDHSSEHRCRSANSRSAGNAIQGNAPAVCGTACLRHAVHCGRPSRSEEHTSELQSLMRTSYAVFCLKKKKKI